MLLTHDNLQECNQFQKSENNMFWEGPKGCAVVGGWPTQLKKNRVCFYCKNRTEVNKDFLSSHFKWLFCDNNDLFRSDHLKNSIQHPSPLSGCWTIHISSGSGSTHYIESWLGNSTPPEDLPVGPTGEPNRCAAAVFASWNWEAWIKISSDHWCQSR